MRVFPIVRELPRPHLPAVGVDQGRAVGLGRGLVVVEPLFECVRGEAIELLRAICRDDSALVEHVRGFTFLLQGTILRLLNAATILRWYGAGTSHYMYI